MTSGGGVPYGRGSCCCCPERGVPAYAASTITAAETPSHPSLRIKNSFILPAQQGPNKRAVLNSPILGQLAGLSRTILPRIGYSAEVAHERESAPKRRT